VDSKEAIKERKGDYEVRPPPDLISKYRAFADAILVDGEGGVECEGLIEEKADDSEKEGVTELRFHAWVYLHLDGAGFFLEPSTGSRAALDDKRFRLAYALAHLRGCFRYAKINSAWNHEDYWFCRGDTWKKKEAADSSLFSLHLEDNDCWVKLAADMADESGKRLLRPLLGWMTDLKASYTSRPLFWSSFSFPQIPADSYELLYRLGTKHERFMGVKMDYFAPYLLREGCVQTVTILADDECDGGADKVVRLLERFRHRKDRMAARETFPHTCRYHVCTHAGHYGVDA